MLTSLPDRPTWAGTRDADEIALAARVVENPLTGQIPTWGDPGRLVYDVVVAELGDPSRAALDARIVPLTLPVPTALAGDVEAVESAVEPETLRVVAAVA